MTISNNLITKKSYYPKIDGQKFWELDLPQQMLQQPIVAALLLV